MRALIQRVSEASVKVDGKIVGSIQSGLLIFLGVMQNDKPNMCSQLAQKIVDLRIFADADDKMNRSLKDIHGEALVVSQFTLAADLSQGRRPSFTQAAPAELAQELYKHFIAELQQLGVKVATGQFAAKMQVTLSNQGPVTIWLDTELF